MARVTGIGGVFFRADAPKELKAWYAAQLGIPDAGGHVAFPWRHADDTSREGMTVWETFPRDTKYFGPTQPAFMINYIVDDLDALLDSLRAAGADVDDRREDHPYGRFAWVTDPEGNRIELWEPPAKEPTIAAE
ncbi:MAG TPA: VOC family protein [Isosphaeraceae bacterium]|jgi:predicted enzyme related to lactoylglutathione lyase